VVGREPVERSVKSYPGTYDVSLFFQIGIGRAWLPEIEIYKSSQNDLFKNKKIILPLRREVQIGWRRLAISSNSVQNEKFMNYVKAER
jgi:hypothetical protein